MPAAKKPKPAPKKPEASPPAIVEHAELHAQVYTLPALLARMPAGPAITAEQVLLYIDLPTEQLVLMGQQVRTERIDTDTARLLGTAYDFARSATPAQRRAVPSLTEQRLRVSIWAAAHGQQLNLEPPRPARARRRPTQERRALRCAAGQGRGDGAAQGAVCDPVLADWRAEAARGRAAGCLRALGEAARAGRLTAGAGGAAGALPSATPIPRSRHGGPRWCWMASWPPRVVPCPSRC
jgi:hypothetical protein